MTRKAFDQTVEFILGLDRARSPEEICRMLLTFARQFGAEHILAGTIPAVGTSRKEQLSNVVLDYWPAEWIQRYFTHGYIFRDPAILGVRTMNAPFLWDDIEPLYRNNPAARRIMEEAGDFKLRQGFTIPMMTLEGDIAGFSLAGERLEVSPEERQMLTLMATYALARSLVLRQSEPKRIVTLTPRELEALQWAAEGMSEWEVGERMGISEHGVDKHMRSARSKLGTKSRVHAVAEAIRLGLIK
jgi:LuxR family transcriptional regulator, quorum-sensing system regulator BjaR1